MVAIGRARSIPICHPGHVLAPLLRSHISLPYLLERKKSLPSFRKVRLNSAIVLSVQRQKLRKLRKHLHKLAPRPAESNWSRYEHTADHYTTEDRAHKREFVERVLETTRAKNVLDIGANTGEYSRLAAQAGAQVVSWETSKLGFQDMITSYDYSRTTTIFDEESDPRGAGTPLLDS